MQVLTKALHNFASYCGLAAKGERGCDPILEIQKNINAATKGATPLADLLLYDYIDDATGIITNCDGTKGFWYEISPIVGSDDSIEKNLTLFFNDELPEGGYLQFLIVASHNISNILSTWAKSRTYGGVELASLTNYRKWFIQTLSQDFAGASDGRLARNFRTFVTYSSASKLNPKSSYAFTTFQKKLENKLKTEKLSPRQMHARDLIFVAKDILQMDVNTTDTKTTYNPRNSLSDQICSPLTSSTVTPTHINHDTTSLQSRIFYPKELPESFSLSEMIALLGSGDKTIPARFVISYCLANNLGVKGKSRLLAQGHRSIRAAEKDYTRHDIGAKEQAREWREVLNLNKKGERFLSESMLVMITTRAADIDIAEEMLKSLWNAEGWKLAINTNLQLMSAIAILPMMQASFWKSLSFFKLTRFALSGEVVAKLPIQGEWKGVPASGVLMMGRRGKLFNFNPYYRIGGGGNYNISMMAPSGSGKSFFLQELATSILAQDVAVFVMDIGASYKNICHLLGGEMVRFNQENTISLNPFASLSNSGAVYIKALELLSRGKDINEISSITGLNVEKLEALIYGKTNATNVDKEKEAIEVLEIKSVNAASATKSHFVTKDSVIYAKTLLASMCGVSSLAREEAIIERAISIGISMHGTSLDITKLSSVLENLKDRNGESVEGAARLADSLYPYTEDGIHGRFFKTGQAASFNEMLTVFEFEELVNDEPLLAVVLQIILMQITMQFLCGNRTRKFMLIVDEAWMIMDFAASFLERFARTVRKYGGSLVVCTQDLSSFSKGPSQSAILESSTWKLILQQKEEGVASFAKEEGYRKYIDLIRSIRKCSNNKFSEILFDTNGAKVVGRLVTDPYSTALYSTESDDFAFLINMEKLGFTKHEAILELSKKYGYVQELVESMPSMKRVA